MAMLNKVKSKIRLKNFDKKYFISIPTISQVYYCNFFYQFFCYCIGEAYSDIIFPRKWHF